MSFVSVDGDVHTQIFAALPIHFDVVESSEGVDEMVHVGLIRPHHREIIYHQRKSDRPAAVPKHGGRARDLCVSIALQVLEQSLLAQSASLRETIMGPVDRTIKGVIVDEPL